MYNSFRKQFYSYSGTLALSKKLAAAVDLSYFLSLPDEILFGIMLCGIERDLLYICKDWNLWAKKFIYRDYRVGDRRALLRVSKTNDWDLFRGILKRGNVFKYPRAFIDVLKRIEDKNTATDIIVEVKSILRIDLTTEAIYVFHESKLYVLRNIRILTSANSQEYYSLESLHQ